MRVHGLGSPRLCRHGVECLARWARNVLGTSGLKLSLQRSVPIGLGSRLCEVGVQRFGFIKADKFRVLGSRVTAVLIGNAQFANLGSEKP